MKSSKVLNKCLNVSREIRHVCKEKNKHFSFLIDKNKIVSVGWNDGWKTHPDSKKRGYLFSAHHSEFSAIYKYKGWKSDICNYDMVNIRINTLGKIGMSKPCNLCRELIKSFGIKKVWYTDENGNFQLEKI